MKEYIYPISLRNASIVKVFTVNDNAIVKV